MLGIGIGVLQMHKCKLRTFVHLSSGTTVATRWFAPAILEDAWDDTLPATVPAQFAYAAVLAAALSVTA